MSSKVTFTVNGKQFEVDDVSATTRLVTFLHENRLVGSHITCFQGGCGVCTVSARVTDPDTGDKKTQTVYSCLVPVLACDGWEITTIEGLGNRFDGYHVVEKRLAEYGGSQCGYCSPGMVMNMYGLMQSRESWSDRDVEHQLDGTLCRCTGYRPILDAFKSLSPKDIEDTPVPGCAGGNKTSCGGCCSAEKGKKAGGGGAPTQQPRPSSIQLKDSTWHQPANLQALFDILRTLPEGTKYTLVCGDTAQAVYYDGPFSDYIYIRHIPELSRVVIGDEVVIGANVSITRVMKELTTLASSLSGYGYGAQLAETWEQLGSTSLRNLGSWAGNIAAKVAHLDFPSDVFIGLLGAGAVIVTGSPDGSTARHTLEELLTIDLIGQRRVILEMRLSPMPDDTVFRVFKVLPRATNAKAEVNAVFRMRVDVDNAHTVIGSPVIAYGGINPSFVHATATEAALAGQSLEDNEVLKSAMALLASEVIPDDVPGEVSPEFRLAVAQNLLYKTVLGSLGSLANPSVVSGASTMKRPLSSGQQTFDQNPDTWPVGQPVQKIEAGIQCSGEAEYVVKMPTQPGELFGVFVTSTQANARLVSIDASAALAMPGVVDFLTAADITGVNNIRVFSWPKPEPLFAEARVSYFGQPVGLLLAANRELANAARSAVKVTYEDIQPPILTIDEALESPLPPDQNPPVIEGDVEAGFAASTHIVEGTMSRGGQYHFHMENQTTLVIPTDIGMDVYSSTQWAAETQRAIGQVLDVPDNKIHVSVKRLGGGFGAKINRGNIVAAAAALASHKVHRPVRVYLDLAENMTIIGGREPYKCIYKVGVDDAGILQAVQARIICDSGYVESDVSSPVAASSLASCYSCPNWKIMPEFVLTNTAVNTWCRGPGTTEGATFMENMLEHAAAELGMDPLEFRQKNLMPDGAKRRLNEGLVRLCARIPHNEKMSLPDNITVPRNLISDMISQILTSAEVEQRKTQVVEFNQANLWKKRGLAVMPMLYPHVVPLIYPFSVMVSINARDGSVSISHGGAEIGQGINTKVAQVAAYELRIPLEYISIHPTTTLINPNSQTTGGSLTTETCAYCVQEACKLLRIRLDDVQQQAGTDLPWPELILTAFDNGVDISQRYVNGVGETKSYSVFGVACSEVELDVLTGQFLVLRTDILEDAGRSLSPLLDVGQVEGAFIMGQGLFTTEKLIYHPTTGKKLTDSTWNYKPLLALDIPVDFRVTLLQNAPNPVGVQSSKVTSEPPISLSFSVVMALRQAVASARQDGGTTGWFQMDAPLTVESLQRLCLVDPSRFTF